MRATLLMALGLFPGLSNAQFGAPEIVVPNGGFEPFRAIDANHDGSLDLVRLESGLGFVLYPNADGLGAFGAAAVLLPESGSVSTWAMGDLTGDGSPDLAFSSSGSLYWSMNNGSGGFSPPVALWDHASQGVDALRIELAELTGDGWDDIVVAAATGIEEKQLFFAANTGGAFGSFNPIGPLVTGALPAFVANGNMDLEGGNDLLVQDGNNAVIVLRNLDGDGTAWLADTLMLFVAPDSFMEARLLDMDGDGDLDIVETGFTSILYWRENPLEEGGTWGPWPLHQLEPWTTAGPAAFGNLGCGSGAGYVCVPNNPGAQPRYAHWVANVGAISHRQDLPDLPRGTDLILADFNADGQDDLVMRFEDDWLLLMNTIQPAAAPAVLPALEPVCKFGNEVPLPAAQPPNGQWFGPGVFQNELLRQMLPGSGTFTLAYTGYDAGGCAVGDQALAMVVEEPTVSPALGDAYCRNEPPIQLTSAPAGVTWFGAGPDGIFDPATFPGGIVAAMFTDFTGESCMFESFPIEIQTPVPVSIDSVGPFCVNSGPQLITGSTVSPFPYWSGDIASWNSSGATFLPAQGAGTYAVVMIADPIVPTQCSGFDTLYIVVNDQFPDIEIEELPILCATSDPLDLVPLVSPEGGIWAGPGIVGSSFDPGSVAAGAYLITYTASLAGCLGSEVAAIKVFDAAEVVPGNNLELCPTDDPVLFTGFPEGGEWGAPIASDGAFDPMTAGVGIHYVSYLWTGADGCQLMALEQSVTVLPTTTVEIESTGILCDNLTEVLVIGSPAGIWTGAAQGEGDFVVVNPAALGQGSWPITLTATAAGQCAGSSTVELIVEVCTRLNGQADPLAEAWPNPHPGQLHLQVGAQALRGLHLLDAAGRIVESWGPQPAGALLLVEQQSAPAGIYSLQLEAESGSVQHLRIVRL